MGALSKTVKLRFKSRPKGFVKALKQELEDKIQADTPVDEDVLRPSTRVTVKADGSVRISNRRHYASYVDKSGPRVGGVGRKGWFSKNTKASEVNKLARKIRKRISGK